MRYFSLLLIAFCFANCQTKATTENANAQANTGIQAPNNSTTPTEAKPTTTPKTDVQTPITPTPEAMPLNGMFHRAYDMGPFIFNLFVENGENTTFKLESEKLSRAFNERYTFEGQITDGVVLDLDNDGFKELYLTCSITDDSGNKDIMGWASYRDKAAGQIYVDDTKMIRAMNTDKVYAKDGKLYRSFKDENGTSKVFEYLLTRGEAGMRLTPKAI